MSTIKEPRITITSQSLMQIATIAESLEAAYRQKGVFTADPSRLRPMIYKALVKFVKDVKGNEAEIDEAYQELFGLNENQDLKREPEYKVL
jgi:hypothetical protein